MQDRGLAGQVALVTGASSGLGRATAIALAHLGASVALIARSERDLESLVEELRSDRHQALALPCDLADADALTRAFQLARNELGQPLALVNAAATDIPGSVVDLSVDEWDRVLAVNLRAVFLLCRLVVPGMLDAGRGTIVNVSSVAGKRGWARASAYCASKFALTGFTQALGAEVRPHGVRACVVYPGAMATHWGSWSGDERQPDLSETSPRDALPPETVAALIASIATAPDELVLDEVIATPLNEQGYP
jgi:NAD(P)-dependent dehydrogenase (short-subunit alcohol dehydrogenase family)